MYSLPGSFELLSWGLPFLELPLPDLPPSLEAAHCFAALLLRFSDAEKRQERDSQLAGLTLGELQAGRGRLDKLPQHYRERYEARLKEITARGQRDANEFLELLEAEHRTVRSKRRDKRK